MSEPVAVLEIIQPGALTSIQDLGRKGYQRLGIAEAGAMDTISFVAANRLVGNPDNAAGLEVTIVGPKMKCLSDIIFGLTGADLSAHLDEVPLTPGRCYEARSGQTLCFGKRSRGVRAYLSVRGGLQSELILGSRSTYIYAGFGGLEGRALKTGDTLFRLPDEGLVGLPRDPVPDELLVPEDGSRTLRVVMGPNEDRFTEQGIKNFLESSYKVTPESNRMGYRLDGPKISHKESPIVVSESTPLGAVQVPGQGTPVLLLRERGTTGGYTKIAFIITVDIDVVSQTFPGREIRFRAVELSEAHDALKTRRKIIDAWSPSIGDEISSKSESNGGEIHERD